uniref:Putative secreted protein n=1 Tax=Ixodes ricinus TaxID=34613 RepID=A0A6B0U4X2_IXORI
MIIGGRGSRFHLVTPLCVSAWWSGAIGREENELSRDYVNDLSDVKESTFMQQHLFALFFVKQLVLLIAKARMPITAE